MKILLRIAIVVGISAPADAAVHYFHWDKPHHGNRGNVTALDLSARKILWEVNPSKSTNFVHETTNGVLTGNDEGEVVLLDKEDGKVVWRCRLEITKAEIKTPWRIPRTGFWWHPAIRFSGSSAATGSSCSGATTPAPL